MWVTWAAVTGQEIYPELTSGIPYVQTARARARRAPWFREARPVVRALDPVAGWRVPAGTPARQEAWPSVGKSETAEPRMPRIPAEAEPGLVPGCLKMVRHTRRLALDEGQTEMVRQVLVAKGPKRSR